MEALQEECRIGSETIGALPIIASYLKRMKIAHFIDILTDNIRSNGSRMSHGDTSFIMILYLFCRPHVISKMEMWVEQTMYLRVLYPEIKGEYFTEARIEDTLDAINRAGIDNISFQQNAHICEEFKLNADNVFVDLTNFTVYGDYNVSESGATLVTFGKPKSGKTSLKQFAEEVAVVGDGGVPVYSKTLDGNTADVTRYWPMWQELRKLLKNTDFMMIGDCKLASNENLVNISSHSGYYLGPEYSTNHKELTKQLSENHKHEKLHEVQKSKNYSVVYSGFETEATITDPVTKNTYPQRRIYVHTTQLEADERETLKRHINECDKKLKGIQANTLLNKYTSTEVLKNSINKTISSFKVSGLVANINVIETNEIIKKAKTKGRHGKNTQYEEIELTKRQFSYEWDEASIKQSESECGYFVLVTNKPVEKLSIQEALQTYKKQFKVETVFSRLKGPLQVIPIRLELPRRIESMMYMLISCVQVMTLMDRTAEQNLSSKNKKLHGLFPKNRGVERPKAEYMTDGLRKLSLEFVQIGGTVKVQVGHLHSLECELLDLMGAETQLYSKEYCADRLTKSEIMDYEEFNNLLNNYIFVKQSKTE
jgi:transposase